MVGGTRTDLSPLADAMNRPSGENATAMIECVCPAREFIDYSTSMITDLEPLRGLSF